MDLRRSDLDGLNRLAELWKTTPGAEMEAMLTGLDLTGWQDVIQYLRRLGMRENPQLVKMNICLSNNIRFTLEGAGVIQAYCRDNRITDKPFVAMLKEAIADADPVTLGAYSAKAKLKREVPLAADDARVKDAISRWDQIGKHFRNIQRFEFVAPGGIPIRFDVSIVKENAGKPTRTFQEARVTTQPVRYEVEVELTAERESTEPKRAVQHVVRGLSWLLQGRQRSFVLVSNQAADFVRSSIGGSGNRSNRGQIFRYPGPQPATLERKNIVADAEPGVPNLRTLPGGYNVTDKADGLRTLLHVTDNGRVYLVDGGGRVYATGRQADPKIAGVILDGEWIRRDRKGATVSHYYAFDILAAAGGDKKVAAMPFMVAGAMFGTPAAAATRQTAMANYVGILGAATQTVRGIPASENLQISMKTFRSAAGDDIFQSCVATLEDARSAPYNTDGLIFTPNAAALPLGRGTWAEQLKWKPPHENTIDFLVIVDRERGKDGKPLPTDAIGNKYRDDSGQTVRFKTLRLFVGSSRDAAFADPRTTVLGGEPLPATMDNGEWREVEFRPVDPRDPMASICYVAIGEGSADPAGATETATALDPDTDVIRTTRTGDIIQSDMIVEMAYHSERSPGWRWEPVRVRHDKTERWLAAGTRKGGTMNADWVANSIWNSLHNPVTEDAVRTGRVVQCAAPTAILAHGGRRAGARDLMKVQCMRNFHEYVKRMLLKRTLVAGSSVCDLAMAEGDDIGKWIAAQVGFAFGCDVHAAAINNPEDGAYRRLLNKMVELGGRDRVPPMVFAQADAARSLVTGEAGATADDTAILKKVFAEVRQFDMVSSMFAVQDMFRDEATLAGFLTNLADTIKVGGYFVGCVRDGDEVARALATDDMSVVGRDGKADAWMITKRFGSGIGATVPPNVTGLGLAIDVEFMVAGETHTEYLVSWPYLQSRLAECGLEMLNAEELAAVGLPASTQMFAETWAAADATGDKFAMTDAIRRMSFMNRWFVLKRRTESRPRLVTLLPRNAAPAPEDIIHLPAVPEENAEAEAVSEKEEEAEVEAKADPFLINPAAAPDMRLGEELSDWPFYLSLGTQIELEDLADPSVKYASIEAAIASAKYQKASNKPELGPTLFSTNGAIHQRFSGANSTPESLRKSYADEVAAVRLASGRAKMKALGATFNADTWESVKGDVYQAYLAQRFAKDDRFRAMVQAIKERGEILFVNGKEPTDLGVGLLDDGTVVGGENKIGKWIQALA